MFMSDAWLLAESFEHSHRLIAAINALSIYTKLALAGVSDDSRRSDVEQGRELLREFLTVLERLVPEVESHANAALPGQAPRAGDFVRRFVQARREKPHSSAIFSLPLEDFARLLDSKTPQDRRELVDGLKTLRELIEQHHYSDLSAMLGEL
jgi:hypothetical protein